MTKKIIPLGQQISKASEIDFDSKKRELSLRCKSYLENGMSFAKIAEILNKENIKTKTGKKWSSSNVFVLIKNPEPPAPRNKSKKELKIEANGHKKKGRSRTKDINLLWMSNDFLHLDEWRKLAIEWLHGQEAGLAQALRAINAFMDFLIKENIPSDPRILFLQKTIMPDLYNSIWGLKLTHSNILTHNKIHYFLQWVLTREDFCEEDDDGCLRTSPAFRNPIPTLTRSGLPKHEESVRPTLPYGYIDEIRLMIAEGANFRDWKWAQNPIGKPKRGSSKKDEFVRASPIWFEVAPEIIDTSDPDCVWRKRTRLVPSRPGLIGQGRKKETIYEMWSPVRWVALLVKLQIPLRTLQVRMLDSGEADTWNFKNGEWSYNEHHLRKGDKSKPYANGVFLRPNKITDGDANVLLYINTNKTADHVKASSKKGYTIPWLINAPLHQDTFYWLEKIRRWQEKYNPIDKLTRWSDLDGRHIPLKSGIQLATYPDTAFLFRTAEVIENPDFPLSISSLERPWFRCLEELQNRLQIRGDTMPDGSPIRLIPEDAFRKNANTTFFSLHSLRVSLITALALDGEVPLAILQKIAGHSRLVMTLYYTKPGAQQIQESIQAGVTRLNENAGDSIIDWLANADYEQIKQNAICNSLDTVRAAISEEKHLRSPAGWMQMVDGLCLVGGNNTEVEAPGCHNGGVNIGNETSPRYTSVQGGARNCPMCRWFITQPYYLPQLAARWNNAYYHCQDAKEQVVIAEKRFREIEDIRAESVSTGNLFTEKKIYIAAERALQQAIKKFDDLTQTVAAITKLIERCRSSLVHGNGTTLLANSRISDLNFAIEETNSELLQISGVCEGSILYPDLEPGKAILRQSQILDAALIRENLPPLFLLLNEEEQKLVGSALLNQLSLQMNPKNPALGRYQVINIIDAGQSLSGSLGSVVENALQIASGEKYNSFKIKALGTKGI